MNRSREGSRERISFTDKFNNSISKADWNLVDVSFYNEAKRYD